MRSKVMALTIPLALLALFSVPTPAWGREAAASTGQFKAVLRGYEEVPAVSTTGRGEFRAEIMRDGSVQYELSYSRLEAAATAAHIHFGQRRVNGGVVAFLCGGGSKPACPPGTSERVTVRGTITASDIVGPANQGIEAGALAEAVRALRAGVTYANVHSTRFPDGEIRGQILHGSRAEQDSNEDREEQSAARD